MEKNRRRRRLFFLRLSAALLGIVLLCTTMMPAWGAMSSSEFSEKTKQYDIAVVYDNSLSMFWEKGNYIERWSRAKFAMEIFASMLNYDNGDTLTIFPMWKVSTDGNVPTVSDAKDAAKTYLAGKRDYVKIERRADIDRITNMVTIHADDTPFDAVDNAAGYLKELKPGSDQHEKWLIILTDGVFDTYKKAKIEGNQFDLGKEIESICPDDVKIQYLSIDQDAKVKTSRSDFYVDEAHGEEIQQKLIDICNRIFERNELPIQSKTAFNLPLSMKTLIVFAQGKGVEIKGLQYEDGTESEITLNSGQRRYSDPEKSMGHGKAEKNPRDASGKNLIKTDTGLYGQVVTFSDCKTGNCKLSISGQPTKLQVFYAPDVRVQTDLIDQKTNTKIKEGDKVYPGKYTVKASLVDRQTGKDVTDSPLLGGDLTYDISIKKEDKEKKGSYKETKIKNGDTVQLEEGRTGIDVEVSYLKGKYTVRNTDSPFSWNAPKPFSVELPQESVLKVSAKCLQPNNWYQLKKSETWQPVSVRVEMDGQPLTDKQMKALDISYEIDGHPSVALSHKLTGDSAFEVYIGVDKDGQFQKPEELIGSLKVKAKSVDEYKRTLSDSASVPVEIHKHSIFWRFIVAGSIIAALIAAVLWFMSCKVLPKDVKATQQVFKGSDVVMEGQGRATLDKKAKRLRVTSPQASEPMNCRISFDVEPESRRWTRSKERQYRITRIYGAASTVERVEINSLGYIKNENGVFVSEDNPEVPFKINPRSAFYITIFAEEAQFDCKVINK